MNLTWGTARVTYLKRRTKVALAALALVMGMGAADASQGVGLATNIVTETPGPGGFPLVQNGQAAALCLDGADGIGVLRAGADLQADIERVTGIKPVLNTNGISTGPPAVWSCSNEPLIPKQRPKFPLQRHQTENL
jgi:hypothetical protein